MANEPANGYKIIADNRKARFEYEILETFEAGIELKGTEVKSIRAGKVNVGEGFVLIRDGEALLHNVHISPHSTTGNYFNHEPRRTRRLLLHKKEIQRLLGQVEQKGLTLVPLRLYLKNGWVKALIALARGKKLHDKREDLKRKQSDREIARAMKQL
ncbi:MAG: SsrA-binding protein SmpB [Cyanobacteria bacterium]|nr:SsrA-binding protein SmpB [Cyanobacteriota bacterium]